MPEYLAPGVYVEETSFRSKSIEGVSTTTTGFIGPTRYGPIDLVPEILTSLADFERTYGDRQQLEFTDLDLRPMHNWMWHAVRAFFEEGGSRLYVSRVFRADPDSGIDGFARATLPGGLLMEDGQLPANPSDLTPEELLPSALHVRARFPGKPGDGRVTITLSRGQNILGSQMVRNPDGTTGNVPTVHALQANDVVFISHLNSPPDSPPGSGSFYLAEETIDPATKAATWQFSTLKSGDTPIPLEHLVPSTNPNAPGDQIYIVTATVTVSPSDDNSLPRVWGDLPLDPGHKLGRTPDSLFAQFAPRPASLSLARTLPVVITPGADILSGLQVLDVLLNAKSDLGAMLNSADSTDLQRSISIDLDGGSDGARPTFDEYEGQDDPNTTFKTGLKLFEDLDDISIVAAPGSTFGYSNGYHDNALTITHLLIAHAEKMRYRIAVLDSGDGQSISEVRAMRGTLDSSYAAIYFPWVRVLDPVTQQEINLPPSGFVSGIYARNDVKRAVYKAPANEVVNLALGFEQSINKAQQEVLNPEGVNCFRFFEGRGNRLWGARTISSDPEWKYVNLRRYFAYLEHSIDKGTQWAVFEPNGYLLWNNVRRTISDFLLNEFQMGALLGEKPEQAYFVRCDRSTMTQNDLDNGRLVCLIGVAPLRPAEFVIFRIGQWTADSKV